jgi:hypothetical protein
MSLRIAIFKIINRGSEEMPRRLQFAQNVTIC